MKLKIYELKLNIFVFIFALLLNSCSYTPVAFYAKNQISDKTYVNVHIDAQNSQYTPVLKDSVNEMLIAKFDSQLVDTANLATTIVDVSMKSLSFEALQTSTTGFVNFYRAQVTIHITYNNLNKKIKKSLILSDYYDYGVDENAISSQKAQEDAVRLAIKKSLNSMFSRIAINAI